MKNYTRNRIYITPAKQEIIKKFKLLFAGCGIGSNIAECALRLGFEDISLIDGDRVGLTNLNRQNYIYEDLSQRKTTALKKRLLEINPIAIIKTYDQYLKAPDIYNILPGHQIAVNALDFQSDIPFLFDKLCQEYNIAIVHPYNIGRATLVFVIMPDGPNLTDISTDYVGFEKKVASFLVDHISGKAKHWIKNILLEYEADGKDQSPPQLSVGSWLAAGACTDIMYKLAIGKPVKTFPDFYFLTIDQ